MTKTLEKISVIIISLIVLSGCSSPDVPEKMRFEDVSYVYTQFDQCLSTCYRRYELKTFSQREWDDDEVYERACEQDCHHEWIRTQGNLHCAN